MILRSSLSVIDGFHDQSQSSRVATFTRTVLLHQQGVRTGLQMSQEQQTKAVMNQRTSTAAASKVAGPASHLMDFYVWWRPLENEKEFKAERGQALMFPEVSSLQADVKCSYACVQVLRQQTSHQSSFYIIILF